MRNTNDHDLCAIAGGHAGATPAASRHTKRQAVENSFGILPPVRDIQRHA